MKAPLAPSFVQIAGSIGGAVLRHWRLAYVAAVLNF
jgi:hypothetical protein